jgi:DNA-binding CsgD family transcriptional regulator
MREPRMISRRQRRAGQRGTTGGRLTDREVEVLWLISDGLSNKRIADRLDISQHTVKFHVDNALGKMGTTSRTKAAVDFVLWHWRDALQRVRPGSPRGEFAAYRNQVLATWAQQGIGELGPVATAGSRLP